MKKHKWIWLELLLLVCFICGCSTPIQGNSTQQTTKEDIDTGFYTLGVNEFDSKDTAIIANVSEQDQTITFLNTIVNKFYTLHYDGTTVITDRFGGAMSATQLKQGDIADVCFQHIAKKCVSIQLSPSAWQYDVKNGFTMNPARGQMVIDESVYTLADRMIVTSGGDEINLMDLNERDVLSVKGIDKTIYSIQVEKGHGYLRLTGSEYFVDGFIEVGQVMVQRITEDMLLTVPEGEYKIVVRNGRHGGMKPATIFRDEETLLDVSDLKGEDVKTGNVFFTLTPTDANVYIDGNKIDTSEPIALEYGIHQMIVKASGYETISQYLKVGQENANLNVELELADGANATEETGGEEQEEADLSAYDSLPTQEQSQNMTGSSEEKPPSQTTTANNGYYVKINAPSQAEVYVDGNYVGIAPVSFAKKEGSHVISLRRNGYQTRSYTIQVEDEEKDMELSFSELVKKPDTTLGTTSTTGGDAATWANDILSQTLLK